MSVYSLSYDDGPMKFTDAMLDMLESRGGRATFFVLGGRVEGNEAILRRMLDLGCEIGNHGWTHTPMTRLSDDELRDELRRTALAIRLAVNEDIALPLMRPPYHNRDERVDAIIAAEGYKRAFTDNDPGDYGDTEQTIFNYTTKRLRDGSIVNLHDGMPEFGGKGWDHRWHTVAATQRILDYGLERGLHSVTCSELRANGHDLFVK